MYCPCFASSALSEISMPVTTGSVFPALMALISVVRMDALYLASASMNSHKPTRAPIGTPTAIPAANTTAMRMTCRSVGLCHITFALWRVAEGAQRRDANVAHQRAVRRQPVRLGEVFVAAQSARRSLVGIGSLRLTRR